MGAARGHGASLGRGPGDLLRSRRAAPDDHRNLGLRAGPGKERDDCSEEQIIDIYLGKSNHEVNPAKRSRTLCVRTMFTGTPDLIEGKHHPEDAMGPTLIELVDPPEPATATMGVLIEYLEERGETTQTALAANWGRAQTRSA